MMALLIELIKTILRVGILAFLQKIGWKAALAILLGVVVLFGLFIVVTLILVQLLF